MDCFMFIYDEDFLMIISNLCDDLYTWIMRLELVWCDSYALEKKRHLFNCEHVCHFDYWSNPTHDMLKC